MDRFEGLGVHVAGCSTDDLAAQKAFADKHGGFRYPLIADPEAEVAKAYGVYRDDWKVAARATAVIGEDCTVLKAYPDAPLDGKGHAEQVYRDLEELL